MDHIDACHGRSHSPPFMNTRSRSRSRSPSPTDNQPLSFSSIPSRGESSPERRSQVADSIAGSAGVSTPGAWPQSRSSNHDYMRLRRTRSRETRCRCGSTSHLRTSHRSCPLNQRRVTRVEASRQRSGASHRDSAETPRESHAQAHPDNSERNNSWDREESTREQAHAPLHEPNIAEVNPNQPLTHVLFCPNDISNGEYMLVKSSKVGGMLPVRRDWADKVNEYFANIYDPGSLPDSIDAMGAQEVAERVSGGVPWLAFLTMPRSHSRLSRATLTGVLKVWTKVTSQACAVYKAGDDRVLAVAMFLLLPALLVVDSAKEPKGKSARKKWANEQVKRRIRHIEDHGLGGVCHLLDDLDRITNNTARQGKTNGDYGKLDKIERLVNLMQQGDTAKIAMQKVERTPVDRQAVEGAAKQAFEACKESRVHAGMNPDELEKWMKITPGYGGWQKMDPEPSEPPSGFKLPAATEDGDEESGPYRIAKETMCSVLRRIKADSAPYTEGLTAEMARIFLRDANAWESLAQVSECLESDATYHIARLYTGMSNSVQPEDGPPPLLLSLFRRYRGRSIPKPGKTSFRLIEINTFCAAIHDGFITGLHKERLREAHGLFQLCGRKGGADTCIQVGRSRALNLPDTHVRWQADAKSQYLSTDHGVAVEAVANICPPLVHLAVLHAGRSYTHMQIDDTGGWKLEELGPLASSDEVIDTAIISRDRGLCQGGKASGPIASTVQTAFMKELVPRLQEMHVEMGLPGPIPAAHSYADNVFGSCHFSLVPFLFHSINAIGNKYKYTFNDRCVYLQGDEENRDEIQKWIQHQDVELGEYVRRADKSEEVKDLEKVLGVCVATPEEQSVLREFVQAAMEEWIVNARKLVALRNLAVEELILKEGRFMSPSCLAFEALAHQRRGMDHIIKNIGTEDPKILLIWKEATQLHNELLREVMELNDEIPDDLIFPVIARNGKNGGAAVRYLEDLAAPATVGCLVQIWKDAHDILETDVKDYAEHPMGKMLAHATGLAIARIEIANDRFEDLCGDGFDPPATCTQPDFKLMSMLEQIENKANGTQPDLNIPFLKMQSKILQQIDYYEVMSAIADPSTDFSPELGWDAGRLKLFRSTAQLRALQRNGTHVYRMAARHRDVISGIAVRRIVQEGEWKVAIRKQLGLGFTGMSGRIDKNTGTCKCAKGSKAQRFDKQTDQHWATGGCKFSRGNNNNRHLGVQHAVSELQKWANAGKPGSTDVTDYKLSPTQRQAENVDGNKNSAMDTVICHHDAFGKTLWVDFTAFDSLGKTMQEKGRASKGTASCVLNLAHNQKTQAKAEHYAHLADRRDTLLIPFAVDSHGSFSPMDANFLPKPHRKHGYAPDQSYKSTQPMAVLKSIFRSTKGVPPTRGRSRLSREEGLVLTLARLATKGEGQGIKAFDATLGDSVAAGMLAAQVYRHIAHKCIVNSARGAKKAMREHAERSSHF